jgi:hypothetical protein
MHLLLPITRCCCCFLLPFCRCCRCLLPGDCALPLDQPVITAELGFDLDPVSLVQPQLNCPLLRPLPLYLQGAAPTADGGARSVSRQYRHCCCLRLALLLVTTALPPLRLRLLLLVHVPLLPGPL